MSEWVRQKLIEIVALDPMIWADARRCEALLRDLCRSQHKKEITALVTAVREGVVAELRNGSAGAPATAQFDRLLRRLHDDCGLREDVSIWTIETWAAAYGVSVTNPQHAPVTQRSESDSRQSGARPVVQHGVTERFIVGQWGQSPRYTAHIGARVRTHYVDTGSRLEAWQEKYYLAPFCTDGPDWSRAEAYPAPGPTLVDQPAQNAVFAHAPALALSSRDHKHWAGVLKDEVLRSDAMAKLSCASLNLTASPGTTESDFRAQLVLVLRERRNAAVEELHRKYAAKLEAIERRQRRDLQELARYEARASEKAPSSPLSVGGSLLGALFGGGRRGSAISKASSAARRVSGASKERADVAHAEADVGAIRSQLEALNAELEAEVARLESEFDPATIRIETVTLKPCMADIAVEDMALVWVPCRN